MAENFLKNHLISTGWDHDTYSDDRATFHDLNGSQALLIFSQLLESYKDQMEEAKLLCEDEGDDTSLGEYMSLKSVVEQMEKYLRQIVGVEYSKRQIDGVLKKSHYNPNSMYARGPSAYGRY